MIALGVHIIKKGPLPKIKGYRQIQPFKNIKLKRAKTMVKHTFSSSS